MKNLISLLCFLTVASCTVVEQDIPANDSVSFDLSYSYYNYDFEEISYFSEELPQLLFRVIPGKIFGHPTEDILQTVSLSSNRHFTIELPSFLDEQAGYLSVPQLDISPRNSKMLRVGTFHMYSNYMNLMGGGGFINRENGNFILLTYFSKPAQITGTLSLSGESYIHQIEIKGQGWHWLETSQLTPNEYLLKNYDGDHKDIVFMVLVEGVTDA